jgi:hypothetical protein
LKNCQQEGRYIVSKGPTELSSPIKSPAKSRAATPSGRGKKILKAPDAVSASSDPEIQLLLKQFCDSFLQSSCYNSAAKIFLLLYSSKKADLPFLFHFLLLQFS